MSPLRWTVKSTRTLARALAWTGHKASADTVADLLREEGFSLQANWMRTGGRCAAPEHHSHARIIA